MLSLPCAVRHKRSAAVYLPLRLQLWRVAKDTAGVASVCECPIQESNRAVPTQVGTAFRHWLSAFHSVCFVHNASHKSIFPST